MRAPIPEASGLRLALQEARLRLERSSTTAGAAPDERGSESISGASRALARIAAFPLPESERGQALDGIPVSRPGMSSDVAASELRTSFERSGLFYEAHLRAWNSGEFSLEDLRREPQARFGESRAATGEVPFERAAQDDADPSKPPLPVPRELERLVREQLATLETKTAVVPLLAWPGQEATLTIGREEERSAANPRGQAQHAWRATLALCLPRLGEVRLAIAVQDELVRVRAEAASDESRRELAAQAGLLQTALQRNALVLERMELARDER